MSGLPRGWVKTKISDVYDVARGGSPRPIKDFVTSDPNGLNWIRIADASAGGYRIQAAEQKIDKRGLNKTREVFPGDLLLSNSMSFGRPYITDIQGCIHDGWLVLGGPATRHVDTEFAYRCLSSPKVQRQFDEKASGTTVRNLNTDLVSSVQIEIPPLAEQKRIVAKLDALNAKSARARTELARIETLVSRYKQAVLRKAFSGELGRKELSELVIRIKAGKNLRCEERQPHSDEKGVVKVSAVTWGEFRPDQSKTLPSDFEPEEDTRIKSGDFLFSRANTIDLVGAVVIVGDAPDNLYLSDKILRLEFREPIDKWLLWYLRSLMGREALMNISSGNQLSMRNIGQKSLLSLSIPYADFELRDEIVRRIESAFAKIDRLAKEAKRTLELVGRLDEAILAKAFRGELVPQDENDEPAEHLLVRIRAEREATPKGKRGRGARG